MSVHVPAKNNGLLKDFSEEEFNEGIIYREEVRLRTNTGTTKSGSPEEVGDCGIKSTGRRCDTTLGLYEGVFRCYGIAVFLYFLFLLSFDQKGGRQMDEHVLLTLWF